LAQRDNLSAFKESQQEELKLFQGQLLSAIGEVMSTFIGDYGISLEEKSKNLKAQVESEMQGLFSPNKHFFEDPF
jgi:hypothetical protein